MPTAAEQFTTTEQIRFDATNPAALLQPLLSVDGTRSIEFGSHRVLTVAEHPTSPGALVFSLGFGSAGDSSKTPGSTIRAVGTTLQLEQFDSIVRSAFASWQSAAAEQQPISPVNVTYAMSSPSAGDVSLNYVSDNSDAPRLIVTGSTPLLGTEPGRTDDPATEGVPSESISVTTTFPIEAERFDFIGGRALRLGNLPLPGVVDFQIPAQPWLHITVDTDTDNQLATAKVEALSPEGSRSELGTASVTVPTATEFLNTASEFLHGDLSEKWSVPLRLIGTHQTNGATESNVDVTVTGIPQFGPIELSATLTAGSLFDVPADIEFTKRSGTAKVQQTADDTRRCGALGSVDSDGGVFSPRFAISENVAKRIGTDRVAGTVYGTMYENADLSAGALRPGAKPLGTFTVDAVQIHGEPSAATPLEIKVAPGLYEFFGFLDSNGNADPSAPLPDAGDLVLVPVSGYQLLCAEQPIFLEFGLVQT